jgi:hypothetical protein
MRSLSAQLRALRPDAEGTPRIYADANVPVPLVQHMRQRLGWDVLHVVDEDQWRRASDVAHYQRARELERTLVTLDHDYFDERLFPLIDCGGVAVLSAPDDRGFHRLLGDLDALLRLGESAAAPMPLRGRKLHLFPGWTEYV